MLKRLKDFFTGKKKQNPPFTNEQYDQHYENKKRSLEELLGEMYPLVGHAIIPFQIGGTVDMYYFPNALDGTGFVTMELIQPDGSGPKPSTIGTYEFIAFSKFRISDENAKAAFEKIERRLNGILTVLGNYSSEAQLNPLETVEVPVHEGKPYHCVILDEYRKPGVDFRIGDKKHGLLLVIEVFRSEMEYAMKYGSASILNKMKEKGYYPYSDLDREPLV